MNSLKVVGVLPNDYVITDTALLFYDELHIIEKPTVVSNDLDLLESNKIISYKTNVREFGDHQKYSNDKLVLQLCENYDSQSDYIKSLISGDLKAVESNEFRQELDKMLQVSDTFKTFMYAILNGESHMTKFLPIVPDINVNPYTAMTKSSVLQFLNVMIPKMSIRDLIAFKFDHQDKLRRFRVAFNVLQKNHDGELEYALEELSLALSDYNKSVVRLCKKREHSLMRFSLDVMRNIPKLLTGDISSITKIIEFKESQVIDRAALIGLKNHDISSFLYEIQSIK